MSEPTVWVEIPASWVLPQGEFTFLRDDTRKLAFGPVLAIEPTMPPPEDAIRARVADEIADLRASLSVAVRNEAEARASSDQEKTRADIANRVADRERTRAEQMAKDLAAAKSRAEKAEADLTFVHTVLGLFAKADLREELWFHEDQDGIHLSANVSDVFAWGCADAEAITPEQLPVLEQAFDDLLTVHGTEHLAALYGARIRKTRPQGAAFPKETAIAELFNACGPERTVGFGNPKAPPALDQPEEGSHV